MPVTPCPSSLTTPAISKPGLNGSGGFSWYLPWAIRRSAKLMPIACTATRTVPGAIGGDGTSATSIASMGPKARTSAARISVSRQHSRGTDRADFAPRDILDHRRELRREALACGVVENAEARQDCAHGDFRGTACAVV